MKRCNRLYGPLHCRARDTDGHFEWCSGEHPIQISCGGKIHTVGVAAWWEEYTYVGFYYNHMLLFKATQKQLEAAHYLFNMYSGEE